MHYTKSIQTSLRKAGIKHADSMEEMLDHYASQYEELRFNMSHEEALEEVLNYIKSNNIQPINKQSMIQKHKYLFLTCCLILLTVASYNAMNSSSSQNQSEMIAYYEITNDFMDPPYGSPLKSQDISSGFGQRMHPIKKILKLHKGIDFKADIGTEVFTVEKGIVIEAGFDKKFGNFVEIKHDDIYSTRYHHLNSVSVEKNQKVSKDTKIGEVGSTGLSTGPHLHYEIIKEGKNVDPETYLKA